MTGNLRTSMNEQNISKHFYCKQKALTVYNLKIFEYDSIKIVIAKRMENMWTIMLGCIVLSLNAISNAPSKLCWV